MFQMPIKVIVESIKAAKDDKSNNYADFLFTGGMISIPVDNELFGQLKPLEGTEVICIFQMRPQLTVKFNRPVTIFEPVKLVKLQK